MRDYRAGFLGVMAAFFPLSSFIANTKHEAKGRRPWYLPPFPERDAIPHHAAIGRGHQQRALPDRKIRLDGDAGNAEIFQWPLGAAVVLGLALWFGLWLSGEVGYSGRL